MKKLFLIRHAKSSWENSNQSDFDRPLNKRGIADAPVMANRLKKKNIFPSLVVSSPANRAFSTAVIFSKELNFNKGKIISDERIYEAGTRELIAVVRDIKRSDETVFLFGHNPGLTSFTNLLSNKFVPDMPTCAITGIEFELDLWKDVERGSGKIFLFDYPKNHSK